MPDLLTASPSVGSICLDPMSTAEIDAHPDCDRIWATITATKAAAVEQAERGQADPDVLRAAGRDHQRDLDVEEIQTWANQVRSDFAKEHPDQGELPAVKWLQEKISQAEDVL